MTDVCQQGPRLAAQTNVVEREARNQEAPSSFPKLPLSEEKQMGTRTKHGFCGQTFKTSFLLEEPVHLNIS